jgi:hypothetical protein
MKSQETPRVSATAWPHATTAAKLDEALGVLKEQLGAVSSLLVNDVPRATARGRLQRAHVRIAQLEFEARAIYAVALGRSQKVQDLSAADVIEAGEAASLFIVSDAPVPKLEPLSSQESRCPRCSGLLMTWTATGCTPGVPGSPYTEDGDCIPGAPLKFAECDSAIGVMVGHCPVCLARHWSLEVMLHDGGEDAVIELMSDEPDWDAQFTAGRNWMAYAAKNAAGRGYQHIVGPMLVPEGMQTHGRSGVSACGGGAFWQHALAVFESYRPRLEAVQRELVQAVSVNEGMPA